MRILEAANGLSEADLRAVDATRVESHVRADGWRFNGKLSSARSVVYERPESRQFQIRIPMERGLGDYLTLMSQTIVLIAHWQKLAPENLLRFLLLPSPSDVVRLREIGPNTSRGDISIDEARDRLNGIRKVILTAAHEEERPQAYYPRLGQKRPEEFLRRCRLGQTERGSFVFTVICPLDAVADEQSLFPTTPFTRRVTTHMMQSIERLSQAETQREWDKMLDRHAKGVDALSSSISANFCEGLMDLIPDEGATVELAVDWSPTLDPPDVLNQTTRPVRLSTQWLPRLQYISQNLRPQNAPLEKFWFIGTVEELEGDRFSERNEREGDVVVRVLDAEGEPRRTRIDLFADQHQVAIHAYETGRQIRVRGVLQRVGRGFRITQPQDFRLLEPDTLS